MPSTLSRDLKMSPSVIGLAAGGILSSSRERRRHARYPFTGAVEALEWISELSGEATEETATEETATEQKGDSPAGVTAKNSVLNDLVIELMRKGVLAEATGGGMLQRLASAT